jgi:hypothetical protein
LPDPAVQTSIAGDLTRLDAADRLLTTLARALVTTAKAPEAQPCSRLRAIPGIGQLVALVLRYAIYDRRRCPQVQDRGASGRLVACATAAAGQRSGPSGQTLGQTSRTGACAEAAGRLWRNHPAGRQDLARLERTPGQGNALTILAHQVARAVYDRRKRDTACALATCRRESWSRAGAPAASRAAAGLSRAMACVESEAAASVNAQEPIGLVALLPARCLDARAGSCTGATAAQDRRVLPLPRT